MEYVVYKTD